MASLTLIYAFGSIIILSLLLSWISSSKSRPTIQEYFWGDRKLNPSLAANLISTSSFSLNGLLYQTWLGFNIGWWSAFIQLIWCGGFLLLAIYSNRYKCSLDRGTMHGIIGTQFGKKSSLVAAAASFIGFGVLIGWEAVVGSYIVGNVIGISPISTWLLPLSIVFFAGLYTSIGGIKGNAIINLAQNILKISALLIAAFVLINIKSSDAVESLFNSPAASKKFFDAVTFLGGVGLFANLAFSFFWQSVDMSNWQNVSTVIDNRKSNQITTISIAAFLVFLFPGLIGTIIGISLSSHFPVEGSVSDTNILNRFVEALSTYPWLAFGLMAAYGASMLSTMDGYSLAASQAVTWDIALRSKVNHLLSMGVDRPVTEDDDSVVAVARLAIFLVALGGAAIIIAFVSSGIDLFSIVYLVVVAQMSLVGPVIRCMTDPNFHTSDKIGYLPIILALICGYASVLIGSFGDNKSVYTFAPVITIVVSFFVAYLLTKEK